VFGARLKNDMHTLKKAGWELVKSPKNPKLAPYFKKVGGDRYWKFRKTVHR
jgi:hypothetical protein